MMEQAVLGVTESRWREITAFSWLDEADERREDTFSDEQGVIGPWLDDQTEDGGGFLFDLGGSGGEELDESGNASPAERRQDCLLVILNGGKETVDGPVLGFRVTDLEAS